MKIEDELKEKLMRQMKEKLDLKLRIAEERLVIEEHQRLLEDEKKRKEEQGKMEEQRRRLEEERRRIEELHRRTTEEQRKQEQLRLERQRTEAERERMQAERMLLEEERVRLMELHRKTEEERRRLVECPHAAEKGEKHPTNLCDGFTSEKVKDFKTDEAEDVWETVADKVDARPVDSNRLLDEIDLLLDCNSEILTDDESRHPYGHPSEQDDVDRVDLKEAAKSGQEKAPEHSHTGGGRNQTVREIKLVPWKNSSKDESEQKVRFSSEIENSFLLTI